MNTTECLNYSDFQHLRALAQHYQCECNHYSKQDLLKRLHVALHNRQEFVRELQLLDPSKLRFLQFLLYDERDVYGIDDLLLRARFAEFSGKETVSPRALIAEFKKRGWLFVCPHARKQQLFQMPHDLRALYAREWIQSSLAETILAPIPSQFRHEKQWLLDDLRLLLTLIGDQGVALTQTGTIAKKWLQHFMNQCAVPESLQIEGWRFGYGRSARAYPHRFSLLYDFVCAQKWLVETSDRVKLTEHGKHMLELSAVDHWPLMFRFWLRTYQRAIPNIFALVQMMRALSVHWIAMDTLVQLVQHFVKPFYYDEPEQVLRMRLIPMMISFGVFRVAKIDEDTIILQSLEENTNPLKSIANKNRL